MQTAPPRSSVGLIFLLTGYLEAYLTLLSLLKSPNLCHFRTFVPAIPTLGDASLLPPGLAWLACALPTHHSELGSFPKRSDHSGYKLNESTIIITNTTRVSLSYLCQALYGFSFFFNFLVNKIFMMPLYETNTFFIPIWQMMKLWYDETKVETLIEQCPRQNGTSNTWCANQKRRKISG